MNVDNVTRIEIIEDSKRKYVKWNCDPDYSIQDGGRTLKIFIKNKPTDKKTCFKCGSVLERVYTDKKLKTLFCPNKKCHNWLSWR